MKPNRIEISFVPGWGYEAAVVTPYQTTQLYGSKAHVLERAINLLSGTDYDIHDFTVQVVDTDITDSLEVDDDPGLTSSDSTDRYSTDHPSIEIISFENDQIEIRVVNNSDSPVVIWRNVSGRVGTKKVPSGITELSYKVNPDEPTVEFRIEDADGDVLVSIQDPEDQPS